MLVVLDTKVLLSAFIRVDSNPYKLLQGWLDDRFELASSPVQIEELARVSRYPRIRELIGANEAGWLVNRIRERARMVTRLPRVEVSSDPGDNFLLAIAEAAGAEILVSGGKAGVLRLAQHRKTRIVSVADSVAELDLK
jgi:putative PIN family toxin of toxin-antitoxin system